ncbi:hypothetical protein NA57DRAFT_71899 [Rhizodiscina lignyota]|uniref:Oxidase ustYa n=1 Tax=Rhizodiscina lignyota TaxID=1504668 RepID=A0A9P4IKP1_9PEZI|nr:hypothetical protein NA57DRAFT_71899 [Rhizodiscina lignyota]
MYPAVRSNPFSHLWKESYSPVSGDSTEDFPHDENRLVLKLCRQIRILTACCVILLGLLLFPLIKVAVQLPLSSPSLSQSLNPENLLLAPDYPLVAKKFEAVTVTEITAEVEAVWEADMPRGRGFVNVPTGRKDGSEDIYVVSVFHQLHCLYMIQQSFGRAMENSSQVPDQEVWHTYHCTEFLRQAIKCSADPALDTTAANADVPTGRSTTGWDGTHICRDYDSLFAWAEEHRTNERVGAGSLPGHHDGHH